jgi:thioredoxin reductase (NADPH)
VVDCIPSLPNATDAVKRGLLRFCPVCDGYEVSGRRIAIVGQGSGGLGEALFMTTYTRQLTLVTLGMDLSFEERRAAAEAGIAVEERPVEMLAAAQAGVRVTFSGGVERRFDAIYAAFGCAPRSQLGQEVGATLGADSRFIVDDKQETSVQGVWAAGDIVRGLNQISVAMGEAAVAATAIHNRLAGRS